MNVDDPQKPEFASWMSYSKFPRRVRHTRRYVWDNKIQSFLDTVIATRENRNLKIPEGRILYRAQRDIDYSSVSDDDGNEIGVELSGFSAKRMRPLPNQAKEGRVNPCGIPVLYVASNELTAISEVRPWIGSEISVAQVKIVRDLRAIDLTHGHGQNVFAHFLREEPLNSEEKEQAVWIEIDNAFSCPVTLSDNMADYVPTQILAETFRDIGYEAIVYRSQFGDNGYNIALFNVEDGEVINCAPYEVTGVEVKYKEIGNRWFNTTIQR